MKYLVTLHGKNYEVEVEKGEAIMVAASDAAAEAAPQAAPSAPVQAAAPVPAPASAPGGKRVDSPLPGTVTDIKVAVGTLVKKGDVLIIIEAMKMENEVVAPDQGVVGSIACAKGAAVVTGDLLMTLVEQRGS